MGETTTTTTAVLPKPLCKKCNIHEATLDSRAQPVCRDCYISFVASKCSKQLSLLSRDRTRLSGNNAGGHAKEKRYLVGLSLGTSSSALVHLLDQTLEHQASRGRKLTHYIAVVHVDTDLSPSPPPSALPPDAAGPTEVLLEAYRARYPRFHFRRVPVTSALALRSIDWDALVPPPPPPPPPLSGGSLRDGSGIVVEAAKTSAAALPSPSSSSMATRPLTSPQELASASPHEQRDFLRRLLQRLPSATSVADVMRILIRHVLLAEAAAPSGRPVVTSAASDKNADRPDKDGGAVVATTEEEEEDQERSGGYQALLLGHTTTALAELTLAETAKGRGFSLPWLANDGLVAVRRKKKTSLAIASGKGRDHDDEFSAAAVTEPEPATTTTTTTEILVYHPLRDVMRRELATFVALADPPIPGAVISSSSSWLSSSSPPSYLPSAVAAVAAAAARTVVRPSAVVSHKDLSIEEVMARYFADVEADYPSVVANVARTTGKLARLGGAARACGVCSMPLDELGDERWRGEIGGVVGEGRGDDGGGGDDDSGESPRKTTGLCYGCERSIYG